VNRGCSSKALHTDNFLNTTNLGKPGEQDKITKSPTLYFKHCKYIFLAIPSCSYPNFDLANVNFKCRASYKMGSKCKLSCEDEFILVGGETNNECICTNPWTCDWEYLPSKYECVSKTVN
jgi:hypothetical protein